MGHKKVVRIDPLTQALPPGGLDSHAHLDGEGFQEDLEATLARAKACGVTTIINVFLHPNDFAERMHIFDDHPEVFFILGVHPHDAETFGDRELAAIEEGFSKEPRLKALGEIGLDYFRMHSPRELQLAAFSAQLRLARKLDVPVAVHCRDAEADCLLVLESEGFAGYPVLWHCFGGDTSLAQRVLRNGWHISVPGPITYKGNDELRTAIATIPEDRLLLETDCPYLSPEPWRGQRNEPAFTVFTARAVAQACGRPPEEVWQKCGENARRFFRLA
ncbi:MAG: TatD family hydrolase [Desulfovibrio sp.]|jgi:TatD DNase family protein|nr:TatD family hydrolase [Desulfovibrio sp.]